MSIGVTLAGEAVLHFHSHPWCPVGVMWPWPGRPGHMVVHPDTYASILDSLHDIHRYRDPRPELRLRQLELQRWDDDGGAWW